MFSLVPWRRERKGSERLAAQAERPLSLFRPGLLDEWFDRFLAPWMPVALEDWMKEAGLIVEETEEALLVRVDAPGFVAADFDIRTRGGDTVMIVAEHKTVKGDEKAPTVERRLERTLTLPARIDPEKVEAVYRHGVLELRLTRAEPPAPQRKIEVKAA